MIITREWAMPSHETFTIEPISLLVRRYVGNGQGWADPFARDSRLAQFRNDLNPNTKAEHHLDAIEFMDSMSDDLVGVLYDPPYSLRQLKEVYNGIGRSISQLEAQGCLWTKLKDIIARKVKIGGRVIGFGWNTIGMGKNRGFEIEEILIVCHGRLHNDTLITVEKKVAHQEVLAL